MVPYLPAQPLDICFPGALLLFHAGGGGGPVAGFGFGGSFPDYEETLVGGKGDGGCGCGCDWERGK